MIQEPKFSLLVSLYDNEKPAFLEQALESIKGQTLLPTETILVFDGPIRLELSNIVSKYRDVIPSFSVVKLPKNVGLGKALAYGLGFCNCEYVARMDTDDICYPDRFENQMRVISKNKLLSVVGGSIQEFNSNPGDLNRFRKLPSTFPELKKVAVYRNPLNHPTVIFRKSDVISVGSYMNMPFFEDYYLWTRLLRHGFLIENLSSPVLHFRTGNDMIGRRQGLSYVKMELKFLKTIKNEGFVNLFQFYFLLIFRLPIRLLPKKILDGVYKILLR